MATRNPCLTRAMRRALYTTVTVPLVLIAPGALAQEAAEEPIEEIVTTGSRIARDPNVGANVPVQSLGAEDIQLGGSTDIGEVLNDLPSLLGSNSASHSVSGIFGTGSGETAGAAEVGEPILPLRLYVDVSVLANDRIAFNAGSIIDSIIMTVDDYRRIASIEKVIDVASDD